MRIGPEWPLRLGCGCVNLYAGFFLLTDPARFYTYVPVGLSRGASAVASVDAYLRLQGIGELLIALGLVGWFFPRWCVRLASMLLTVEMTLILLLVGVDAVLFRNLGLLGAALSLVISSYQDTGGSMSPRLRRMLVCGIIGSALLVLWGLFSAANSRVGAVDKSGKPAPLPPVYTQPQELALPPHPAPPEPVATIPSPDPPHPAPPEPVASLPSPVLPAQGLSLDTLPVPVVPSRKIIFRWTYDIDPGPHTIGVVWLQVDGGPWREEGRSQPGETGYVYETTALGVAHCLVAIPMEANLTLNRSEPTCLTPQPWRKVTTTTVESE
jgi:hypothetical protein